MPRSLEISIVISKAIGTGQQKKNVIMTVEVAETVRNHDSSKQNYLSM